MFFLTFSLAYPLTAAIAATQSTRPVPQIERALIISIDGLRPDVLLRANAPRITSLYHRGAFTFWARSTPASITLPTHVSMLTGVAPEAHAIQWNGDLPLSKPVYPRVPTLFELAKESGKTTAIVAGKSKFSVLDKPGTIDFKSISESPKSTDDEVVANALSIIRQNKPEVMFVHFPGTDNAGHKFGWGSPEQFEAIAVADGCVGKLLDALVEAKVDDSTLVILTSDHGGAGRTHGPDDARSRHVPWIVAGPGIRQDYDLTRQPDVEVDPYDTFATVCTLLGIPIRGKIRGEFISAILADQELLRAPYESMQPTTNPKESQP